MPTNEGVFPKTGNDPIYASEVNKFNKSLYVYCSGVDTWITSGTNPQDVGSTIIVTTGPSIIEYIFLGKSTGNSCGGISLISGNITNDGLSLNSNLGTASNNFIMDSKFYVGSPYPYINHSIHHYYEGGVATDTSYGVSNIISSVGSYVIKFQGVSSSTGSTYFNWLVKTATVT
jgi:hypothetical protein